MPIILRRSQSFVSLGGPSADDDFDVMDGVARIGRIYFQPASSQPWRWSLAESLAAEKRGRADSRALALQELTEAYAVSQSMVAFFVDPASPNRSSAIVTEHPFNRDWRPRSVCSVGSISKEWQVAFGRADVSGNVEKRNAKVHIRPCLERLY